MLRMLPTWELLKKLRSRTGGGNKNADLGIKLRIRMDGDIDDDVGVSASVTHQDVKSMGFGEHMNPFLC